VLTIFWDVSDPILVPFQGKGQTLTSARYSDMLVNELKPRKAGDFSQKEYCCFTTKPNPHRAAHTVDILRAPKFEVLKNPLYSPDLATSGFYLFGPMKEHLRGHKFCR